MAEITLLDVLDLDKLSTLTEQADIAAVVYNIDHGEPFGLKVSSLIQMDNSIAENTASLALTDASLALTDASLALTDASLAAEVEARGLTDSSLVLKADKSVEIIAGAGLTGGGDLSAARTFNVVSADDGITVNANDIKLNIVNDLTTSSATRALSATQGKKLQDEKEALSNKSTDIVADAASTTKYPSVKLIKDYADSLHPELAFYTRWLADTGTQLDEELLLKVYADYLNNLPETEFLFCPQIASKNRTSGLNQYINTLYDLGEEENDAVQASGATQPYLGGYIAPNENRCLKFVSGQTQTGLLDFTDVVFAAGDSWTLNLTVKANNLGRIYLGSSYIAIGAGSIILHNGTDAVLTGTISPEVGKAYIFEFQYANGAGLIKANNIPLVTVAASKAVTFGQVSYNSSFPFDGAVYFAHLTNTRKSESDSQKEYTILRSVFPEIESIAIGNQVWATSNFEGVVAGDGRVIPEVQGATTDGNAELITNGSFAVDPGSYWSTANSTKAWDSVNFALNVTTLGAAGFGIVKSDLGLTLGKLYRVRFKAKSSVSGLGVVAVGDYGVKYAVSSPATTTAFQDYEFYIKLTGTDFRLYFYAGVAGIVLTFDEISIVEVGADTSTIVYNAVYAATTGTAAVKDIEATIYAAMWCHYDNLAANGAIYGKLYNWYAVHLFDLFPPVKGWRIPSKADFDQLVANQGGSTVAGGKLKAKFGGFDNDKATNESGFSAIPGGKRVSTDSSFTGITTMSYLGTTNLTYSTSWGFALRGAANDILVGGEYAGSGVIGFMSLRMTRNEPAGANELSYTSGLFTTDITSAAKQIPLSFGRMVDAIRIKSENALTAIEAKLHNAAGTAVATLITGKSVSAGATMVFPVSADYAALLQDGTVRVTASGNSGAAVGMEIQVLTHKSVL